MGALQLTISFLNGALKALNIVVSLATLAPLVFDLRLQFVDEAVQLTDFFVAVAKLLLERLLVFFSLLGVPFLQLRFELIHF